MNWLYEIQKNIFGCINTDNETTIDLKQILALHRSHSQID